MKGHRIAIGIVSLGLLLALAIGPAYGQGRPESQGHLGPEGDYGLDAAVSSTITYQGMLLEDGHPVQGSRDMVFRFYTGAGCLPPLGATVSMPGVGVQGGVFTVHLPATEDYFAGQGVWLEVEVEGTAIGCHEILPVPYALSLRPGAQIAGEQAGSDTLLARNTATSGASYGLFAITDSSGGIGAMGMATATGGGAYGLFGLSNSAAGAGVVAKGVEGGADLILAGNSSDNDNGSLWSDPALASSDLVLVTNDTLRLDLDDDGDGEDADFEIRNKDDSLVFNVDESGAVTMGGTGLAAFPRPAYDSGWQAIGAGDTLELAHGMGGNVDSYVVDLQFEGTWGRHQRNIGESAWWFDLTGSSIKVTRASGDAIVDQVRVRIWLVP